MHGETIKKLD